jgi:(p)ppGpp synthase/HD superfamily hydrolase
MLKTVPEASTTDQPLTDGSATALPVSALSVSALSVSALSVPALPVPALAANPKAISDLTEAYGVSLPVWLRDSLLAAQGAQGPQGLAEAGKASRSNDKLLAAAFDFAHQLHDGQMRASGEPYIVHPIAVADLLRDIGAGSSVIAAGFLHDVVEDTQVTPEEIEAQFGAEVRALVEGVTKLGGIHFTNQTEAQAENLRRMFLAMASDIRVVLVKLADRLHNMRTLGALKPEKQQRIARETRDIYAPLANRLGIGRFKWELEDLAFKILEPEAFREIQQQVATKRSEREDRLGVTVQLLRDRLASVGLGSCDVSGRPKHLYGIWSKMQRQHDTFRPIPGRFKDYIGLPKPNGYQSLHTAVIGRHRPIEVQIRTVEMHQVAEYGIAAHWKYKEGGSPAATGGDAERFSWLRQLVDWQKEGGSEDSSDYLASIKEDLFDEEVFVFTPKGDVVGLRKGSTSVDFAYRIHSEVGNHCQGVRINDRLCPLATPLKNGDFVQVITSKSAHPSLDWLNFVATPTARNRIRAWYKRSHRQDNIVRGTEMLERELGRDGLDALLNGEALARVSRRCNLVGTEDLLAAIGFGGVTLQQVVNRLREEVRLATEALAAPPSNEEVAAGVVARKESATLPHLPSNGSPILGVEGLEYRLGGCCSPLPGEAIVGSVALGNHGITIHRQDCSNVAQVPVERRLPVRWNGPVEGHQRRYPVRLRIEVLDRVGVLKDILTRLSDHRINVSDARVRTSAGKPARIDLRVELHSANQLRDTMDQIRSMADVLDLARTGIG